MKNLKIFINFIYVFLFILCCSDLAMSESINQGSNQIDIPSSFNPVGSGARALGMGGAFIAIADDATAASWNPGGLIQLEYPEISMVYNYTKRSEDHIFKSTVSDNSDMYYEDVDLNNINYLSVSYPFHTFNRNMIISLNFQHLYDFSSNWEFHSDSVISILENEEHSVGYTALEQEGDLYALGLAFGLQIAPRISIGATVNYWGDTLSDNSWSSRYVLNLNSDLPFYSINGTHIQHENFDFEGWNFNVGIMWQINDKWAVGCVYKAPFTANIDHSIRLIESKTVELKESIDNLPVIENYEPDDNNTEFNEKMDMPMSYGIGLAYRYSDRITLSADLYRTHWEDFVYTKQNGMKISPVTAQSLDQSDIDSTIWCRMGGEYLFIGDRWVVPLRAGFFYDPAPASESPDNYYGFSLGSGIAYKKWVFDLAFTYRFGYDVGADMVQIENTDFVKDVNEYNLYASIIVHL